MSETKRGTRTRLKYTEKKHIPFVCVKISDDIYCSRRYGIFHMVAYFCHHMIVDMSYLYVYLLDSILFRYYVNLLKNYVDCRQKIMIISPAGLVKNYIYISLSTCIVTCWVVEYLVNCLAKLGLDNIFKHITHIKFLQVTEDNSFWYLGFEWYV